MKILKLIFKNTLRHKLRTTLTILGIAIAVIAFGILRTVVTAWHVGVDASAANRLITRQAVSFIFPLPVTYKEKIASVAGIEQVTFSTWFQGVYIDKNQFFTRMAVDHETFFSVYPEFLLTKEELENFKNERTATIIGADLAKTYNLSIGDVMTLEGDIYPGTWNFTVRGIYQPRDKATDGTMMAFRWDYVNERMQQEWPERANDVGWYIVKINDPNQAAEISTQIDALFLNSRAETKTETERAFAQGFLSSTSAIIDAMNLISFVIIGIIMLVLGNTMIMAARERTREYAVLKTLGFSAKHIVGLILGESLLISAIGSAIGLFFIYPLIEGIGQVIPKGFFPVFHVESITIVLAVSAAMMIGLIASIFPIQRALKTKIVDGFRFVG
ncbi:MAG: ABC transporter ATP-binding protein [Chlorobiaceae bacterium]|nr:ABC transporter ATP-binding protein [Chlorobiaceae bacterium]